MKRLIFLLVCLFSIPAIAQIPLIGNISTNGPASYPTHLDSLGKGGLIVSYDTITRNAIPSLRRKEGMLVSCIKDSTVYVLRGGILNSNWVIFTPSSSIGNVVQGGTANKLLFIDGNGKLATDDALQYDSSRTQKAVIGNGILLNGTVDRYDTLGHQYLDSALWVPQVTFDTSTSVYLPDTTHYPNDNGGGAMFWVPKLNAFRAGYWYDSSDVNEHGIGIHSYAIGDEAMAKAKYSSAFGSSSLVDSGANGGTAIAGGHVYAGGFVAIAGGQSFGIASVSIGAYGGAYGPFSTVLYGATTGVNASGAFAQGGGNSADSVGDLNIGGFTNHVTAYAGSNIGGNSNTVTGQYAVNLGGIGNQAKGRGSLTGGSVSIANGKTSIAYGNSVNTQAFLEVALGSSNVPSGPPDHTSATVGNRAISFGTGGSNSFPRNCWSLWNNGHTDFGDVSTPDSLGFHVRNMPIILDTLAGSTESFVMSNTNGKLYKIPVTTVTAGDGTTTALSFTLAGGTTHLIQDNSTVWVDYADNTAALAAGLTLGWQYRSGDFIKIVH